MNAGYLPVRVDAVYPDVALCMGYLVDVALPPSRRTPSSITGQLTATTYLNFIRIGLCPPTYAPMYFHNAPSYSKRHRFCTCHFAHEIAIMFSSTSEVLRRVGNRRWSKLLSADTIHVDTIPDIVSKLLPTFLWVLSCLEHVFFPPICVPHYILSFVISGTIPLRLASLSSLQTLKVSGNVKLESE